jgi:branched-chain amino acid transport system permease protein
MDILPQLLVNALIAGSIYALASSGLALTYGLLRILNFAHGHLMMVVAYIFYYVSFELNCNLLTSALATAIFCIGLAIISFRIFVFPFARFSFILTFVTTLALSNILEAGVSMVFGVNVKSLSAGSAANSFEIGSIYITPIQILIILSALILLSLLSYTIHSTSIGRRIRALSENPAAAEAIGFNQKRTSYLVFILAVLLAAYAGILVGYETNMQPTMGGAYTIKAFAAMILGGLGNIWGTVLGSYILGLVENLSIGLDFGGYSIPAGYKDAFAFLIILVMLLFRPQGLFGSKQRTS